MKDYYSILGINEYARIDEIKLAYRSLVKMWHPDICTRSDAQVRFAEISEAYEVLSNEIKRKNYDDIRNYETEVQAENSANITFGAKLFAAFKSTFILVFVIVSVFFISVIAYDIYHQINKESSVRYDFQTSR